MVPERALTVVTRRVAREEDGNGVGGVLGKRWGVDLPGRSGVQFRPLRRQGLGTRVVRVSLLVSEGRGVYEYTEWGVKEY